MHTATVEAGMETYSKRGSSLNSKKKRLELGEGFGQNQGFIFLKESCNLSKPNKDVGQKKLVGRIRKQLQTKTK